MKKNASILVVDDEEPIRKLLQTYLTEQYFCITADTAERAIQLISGGFFNVIITDINMPGASGIDLCHIVRQRSPYTVVLMISGMTDIQFAVQAMREGAFDYLTKPFDLSQLMVAVERALAYQELLEAKRDHELELEETVRTRTSELRLMNENLNHTLESLFVNYRATLGALARTLEARDYETAGHSERVVAYCLRLGEEMGLPRRELIALEQGALLHDIGKIGISDSVLLKRGPLTQINWTEMCKHVRHGIRIIDGIDLLSEARPIVAQHHEKFNGSGYPQGLNTSSIHLHARLFAVVDAYDAMTSDRPYRSAMPYSIARDEIISCTGKHFDPMIVESFLKIPESELRDIREAAEGRKYSDQVLCQKDISSFIVSIKHHSGITRLPTTPGTGPL